MGKQPQFTRFTATLSERGILSYGNTDESTFMVSIVIGSSLGEQDEIASKLK